MRVIDISDRDGAVCFKRDCWECATVEVLNGSDEVLACEAHQEAAVAAVMGSEEG